MTDQEFTDLLNAYSLRSVGTKRQDGARVFLAWYEELPGCIAEADSREEAILELDGLVPSILSALESDGVELPIPLTLRGYRPVTNVMELSGLVLGGPIVAANVESAYLTQRPTVIEFEAA